MRVRQAVVAAGYWCRLHRRDSPGSPDLVFPRHNTVVFVNGCFWHWHGCPRRRMPVANRDYWTARIERNVARDAAANHKLESQGWTVLIIRECQINAGIDDLLAWLN